MWYEIFKFELKYRRKRPATYIYFVILLLLCFGAVSSDIVQIGGGSGLVKENAPRVITIMMAIVSAFFMMITSAVMGVSILRDFEHKTESLMFVNPIKKIDYLLGRFLGSLVVTIFIFSSMPLGFMLGDIMPWRDFDRMLPFTLWHYWQPFFVFVLPNLLFSGALFFASGALSRKMIVIYTQGILLFVFYQVALSFTSDVENRIYGAYLDPFAIRTINFITQYWTVSEQNSLLIEMTGVVFWNRVIWLAVGVLTFFITYLAFNFNVVRSGLIKRKKKVSRKKKRVAIEVTIPAVTQKLGLLTSLKQIRRLTFFYFKMIFKEIPFLAIVISGLAILIVNSQYIGQVFGTNTYPTTYLILEEFSGFTLFFIIIIVFYTGELVWRERNVKINLIYDAMPMPDVVTLISKFLGMIFAHVAILFALIVTGILIQTFKGYYDYQIGLYLSRTLTGTMPTLILFTLLGFFIHVVVDQKYVGHAVFILFFVITLVLETLGVEHGLLQFGSGNLGVYSEMNGYGHYPTGYSWFTFYWTAFSVFLFALAVLFSVRGSDSMLKNRWLNSKIRFTRPMASLTIITVMSFVVSGCYIYYNTNVMNEYANSDDTEEARADYEKTLKKYQYLPQPKIVATNMKVELYPKNRDYEAEGYYLLANKHDEPIKDVHIQLNPSDMIEVEALTFEGGAVVKESFEDFDYHIYELKNALQPGDTLKMEFKQKFVTKGFVETGDNTSVIFNGTFFNNTQFPTLGYNEGFELYSDNDREDYDLAPKNRLLPQSDPRGLRNGILGDDGDHIDLEVVIGTDSSQIAVAPGYLQKEWVEGDRKYFHYKMDQPIFNFFNIVSAEYEVMRDTWTPEVDSLGETVNLEIYYHKGHTYNLDRMMRAMKASFDYYSKNFSPYQYRQMRILEFPRYATFAQSFANTVPFSEGIGFMLEIDDEKDVDVAACVTAHELAHQWWAHQVMAADVQGSQMIIESLSQYSALMVMKQIYPEEKVQEFLKEEVNRYLGGRSRETKKELPVALVENQQYIHYGKGAVVWYALQDYIGEEKVNRALSRFVADWNMYEGVPEKGRFPTATDLIGYLREETPDSLQHIITDMLEKIVLYENKVGKATYTQANDDLYQVNLTVSAKKLEADTVGMEEEVALNDWIEVGVFTEDSKGQDSLIYMQKHLLTSGEQTLNIEVDTKPTKAGVDPVYKLIDRNIRDNIKTLSKEEAES